MHFVRLFMLASLVLLTACASRPASKPPQDTPECMNYRHMMTAPMPPDAMQRLKQKCDDSRHKLMN
ncbi:hypothetical protein F3J29_07280 [Enterobacter sp. Cy-643]|uniref:hypothetical protein n=1 Tax=Enterobacter sp. Cy-643 TaxID=2608346 RepID=UPI001421C139|nr:hypothetical protein [Enterobacter sp. Cy-643]NIF31937.1 hypothetical protein [Enterobacter sp. Cy-643]